MENVAGLNEPALPYPYQWLLIAGNVRRRRSFVPITEGQ
jgi:hypothetical protein